MEHKSTSTGTQIEAKADLHFILQCLRGIEWTALQQGLAADRQHPDRQTACLPACLPASDMRCTLRCTSIQSCAAQSSEGQGEGEGQR
jgi:hypothetical protein